jgi:predicted Zn-dependent protease
VAATKLLAEDPFRTLPDPKYYKGRANINLEIFDKDYEKLTPEGRHKIVKTIENSVLQTGGKKIITVTAMEYDNRYESLVMTSNGFSGYTMRLQYISQGPG